MNRTVTTIVMTILVVAVLGLSLAVVLLLLRTPETQIKYVPADPKDATIIVQDAPAAAVELPEVEVRKIEGTLNTNSDVAEDIARRRAKLGLGGPDVSSVYTFDLYNGTAYRLESVDVQLQGRRFRLPGAIEPYANAKRTLDAGIPPAADGKIDWHIVSAIGTKP